MQTEPESSAPKILEGLIRQAETAGASDIHLHMVGKAAQVAFRLDGVLTPLSPLPDEVAERVVGRIKFLARLKTYQDSLPQDGRIDRADVGGNNDIRVATYPTVTGEKIVLRLFQGATSKSLAELGLDDAVCKELERFLSGTSGLLLLTGPAGSGKTTTIYACLRRLAELGGRHIITVEDPVEQILPGVMQTEVNEARGLTFSKAARHLLRQDPQVLVIGEIRDEETANIAVRAALTGHMVISTLHAGSCKGVFDRLLGMCTDRFAVIAVVELVLNQRLLRRLCPQCLGKRCDGCLGTGYKGSVPVVEWVGVDDTLRAKLRTQAAQAVSPNKPLSECARALVQNGISNEPELRRIFGHEAG